MKITVRHLNGAAYPACRQALVFARIAGTRTLSTEALKLIQDLGYVVSIEQPAGLFA